MPKATKLKNLQVPVFLLDALREHIELKGFTGLIIELMYEKVQKEETRKALIKNVKTERS